ncbi:unnamed protein product [Effrenium voratum]|nr:unnamed protein product [Effrenium voratum]
MPAPPSIPRATTSGIEPIVYPVPDFFNASEAPRAAHAEDGIRVSLPSWGDFFPRRSSFSECSTTDTAPKEVPRPKPKPLAFSATVARSAFSAARQVLRGACCNSCGLEPAGSIRAVAN